MGVYQSLGKLQEFTTGRSDRRARVAYIRKLIWSPDIDWSDVGDRTEGDDTLKATVLPVSYNRQICSQLRILFDMLDGWKDRQSNLELSLSVSDEEYACETDMDTTLEEMASFTTNDLWRRAWIPHFFQVTEDNVKDLPILPFVTSFTMDDDRNTLSPSAFFHMLSRFPRVSHISAAESGDPPSAAILGLRERRQDVIKCLPLVPDTVNTFKYQVGYVRELAPTPAYSAANYLYNGLDQFSIALRTLSMRLRELRLEYVRVSSSLFWPSQDEGTSQTAPCWPNLEVLEVLEVPPNTPDGNLPQSLLKTILTRWEYETYYFGPLGIINSHEVDKLYIAIAKAAHQMPRLRRLYHLFRGEYESSEWLEFERDDTGSARLSINSQFEYEIGEGVIAAWGLGEMADEFKKRHHITMERWPVHDV
ncbi:hypothetical protein MW887_003318 [Aspergillus wentii]|nr:hypothetical protein MW887_003318 [Aspergillus wentii]